MTTNFVNIADTGALITLWKTDALDLLIAGGKKVVILEQVIGDLSENGPTQPAVLDWIERNSSSVIREDIPITDEIRRKYNYTGTINKQKAEPCNRAHHQRCKTRHPVEARQFPCRIEPGRLQWL